MKLSVAAYRASACNINRRLNNSSLNGRRRARATSDTQAIRMARSVSWGDAQVASAEDMIILSGSPSAPATPPSRNPWDVSPTMSLEDTAHIALSIGNPSPEKKDDEEPEAEGSEKQGLLQSSARKAPPVRQTSRSRGNQRWMKLRTTVQLTGAVTSAVKEKKPPLKREDSFLKRFSTRQIAEVSSETVDNGAESGDEGGAGAGIPGYGADGWSGYGSRARAAWAWCWWRRRRRRKRRLRRGRLTVINPDENVYFGWLSVLTLCVLYNCWTLIVRQAFPELQSRARGLWLAADGLSDLVFLADVVVQFRTGYLEQGLMVYDSKKLALHYVHSRAFVLDLASLLPLDLVQLWTDQPYPMVRFPRFLKVYRSYNYCYMVESRTLYPNLWRVLNLIHILLLLAHWFGCFFFMLSEAENFEGNWVYPKPEQEFATLTRKYLGSLYWSTLTLTTIGDLPTPESNWHHSHTMTSLATSSGEEPVPPRRAVRSRLLYMTSDRGYLFTIVSYLIGVFVFATIVGQVGNVITNRNASRLEFERLLDGAKLYMRQHKVPREMQRRVQRWYDYSWSRGRMQGGGDINSALGILPDKLKTELALHVNLNTLKKVSIFQECQPEFLHDLVLKMKAYIFTPGDLICRKGEVAREMFIIADGILEVISETGKVLTTMRAGDFFGEIGILNLDGLNKRTADVRSVGYSELFSLSREDVLTAMKDYPEAQEILQSLGRKRLMEAKLAAAGLKRDTDSEAGPAGIASGSKRITESDEGRSNGGSSGVAEGARHKAAQMMQRIKKDARGLRDYLRRGRTREADREQNASEETTRIEMEPMGSGSEMQASSSNVPGDEESAPPPPYPAKMAESSVRKLFWGRKDSDESKESASHTKMGAKTRGILMRMQRVSSQTEPPASPSAVAPATAASTSPQPRDPAGSPSPPDQPLGAGLPLLQRLHLLKEREGRRRSAKLSAPPQLTTIPSEDPHKDPDKEELSVDEAAPPSPPPPALSPPKFPSQPIGAGLPLFQRLRMLKEREERERTEAERQSAAVANSGISGSSGSGGAKLSLPKAALLKKLETLREDEKGESGGAGGGKVETSTSSAMQDQVSAHQEATPPPSSPALTSDTPAATPTPTPQLLEVAPTPLPASSPTPPAATRTDTPHILTPGLRPPEFKPEEYLADLLLGVKQVLQSRLEDIQDQFKSRLISLEEEVRRKDLIIHHLEETLQRCEVYPDSGGVPPTQAAIITESTAPEQNQILEVNEEQEIQLPLSAVEEQSADEAEEYFDDEFEQASDVTHPGYVSHPRRSWPLLPPWSERHRVGVPQRAWESQAALAIDPEHLWRVEFPTERERPTTWVPATDCSSADEPSAAGDADDNDGSAGDASSEDDGQDEPLSQPPSGNQWELQMLAEQLIHSKGVGSTRHPYSRGQKRLAKRPSSDDDTDSSDSHQDDGCGKLRRRTKRKGGGVSKSKVVASSSVEPEPRFEEVDEAAEVPGSGEGGDEGLLGVLQQLSPTERRELERLLAVATRKHFSRQLSLRSAAGTSPDPARRRSFAAPTSGGSADGGSNVRSRHTLAPPSRSSQMAILPTSSQVASSNSAYLHVPVMSSSITATPSTTTVTESAAIAPVGLLSPTDEDSISICIPEYEPLLGPK